MENECTYKVFLNCPSCGTEENNITITETYYGNHNGSQVQCKVCKTSGPWDRNVADAIRKWNNMPREPHREERELV